MNSTKRMIALGLVACMAMTALVGCGDDKDKDKDVNTSVPSTSQTEQTNTPDEQEQEQEGAETANLLENTIKYARTAEENDAYAIVTSPDQPQAETYMQMLGVTADDMEEYAISVSPMNVKAYAVAIIKPAEGKTETVTAGYNAFISSQKQAFEQYLVDQLAIAEDAQVLEIEGYQVLVMCENASDVVAKIKEGLTNPSMIEEQFSSVVDTTEDVVDGVADIAITDDTSSTTNTEEESDTSVASPVAEPSASGSTIDLGDATTSSSIASAGSGVSENGARNTSDTWQ